MLIAQITDLHIGFSGDRPDEPNLLRLERVVDALAALSPAPDLLFATGDLTEHGDEPSFRRLADTLARLPFPVHYALGNHDKRAPFRSAFPDAPDAGGFVQYAIEDGPLRCLVLDTLDENRHGGAFCDVRAQWLADRLDEQPDRPTIIILHHPPVEVGIAWMDPDPAEAWIARLAETIRDHANVIALLAGHVHRPISLPWQGRALTICPSSAPEVGLDFTPTDPAHPENGRLTILEGEPGFAIHRWTGERLITHFGAPPGPVVAELKGVPER
jgi:3',5'-cyclic AMP phosphodiesterase CpdA